MEHKHEENIPLEQVISDMLKVAMSHGKVIFLDEEKNIFEVRHIKELLNEKSHSAKCATSQSKECDCDGYHTFAELYEHRIALWIAYCSLYNSEFETINNKPVWRSKRHSDGSEWEGWFLLGMHKKPGEQITYHLPISEWENTNFAQTLEQAPEFDGHTSQDVLKRLADAQ